MRSQTPTVVVRGVITLIVALGLLSSRAESQQARVLSYGEPEDVGMSSAVLQGAVGLYEEAVERGDMVGAVVLVARNGRVVLHQAIGLKDKEQGLPMERNTMFRMASNTKPVIATAIAQLVEQDQLAYDDLVREFIPEWDNYRAVSFPSATCCPTVAAFGSRACSSSL